MKEQNKKKLSTSKSHFNKVAKEHLKAVAKVWQFFNSQSQQMITGGASDGAVNLQPFNEMIFTIASKLDKCLMLVVACGFSLNSLPQEPETNIYVESTSQLIGKLRSYVHSVE